LKWKITGICLYLAKSGPRWTTYSKLTLDLNGKRRFLILSQDTMQKIIRVLPDRGYAVVVDGLVKTEFETQEGATKGARELKGRFPALQIKIYDAGTKSDQEVVLP
jgi:hypothetical protein